jgi:hypothetical protein
MISGKHLLDNVLDLYIALFKDIALVGKVVVSPASYIQIWRKLYVTYEI